MVTPRFYSTDTKNIVVLCESILRLNEPYACALMSSTPDEKGGTDDLGVGDDDAGASHGQTVVLKTLRSNRQV